MDNRGASDEVTSTALVPVQTSLRRSGDNALDRIMALVLDTVAPRTRRDYRRALDAYLAFLQVTGQPVTKASVQAHIANLRAEGVSDASIRQRLAAIRKLALEAADNELLSESAAQAIQRVKTPAARGQRTGRWLMPDEADQMLARPDTTTLRGLRDRAVLSVLLGAGLRREECARLDKAHLRRRKNRWVIADLVGKHARTRTVPIADWIKRDLDAWTTAAGIINGPIFRRIRKNNLIGPDALSAQAIYLIVRQYNPLEGEDIAAHDLRRTFAESARAAGSPVEQIQQALGHASTETTERYLNVRQDLTTSPSDLLPYGGNA